MAAIYAFDRKSGEKLWPRPVVVQQQGLVLTQPCELPLLFFLSTRHRNTPAGQPEARAIVQVVDKRNGRVWFKRDDLPLMITNFDLSRRPGCQDRDVSPLRHHVHLLAD